MRGEGITVRFNFEGNLGYAADQVDSKITLAALLEAVEAAVNEFGEDAEVVLFQQNNGRGANFGRFNEWTTFQQEDTDEDEDF